MRGLAAAAAFLVACTFPEKHSDAVDATQIDAAQIDAALVDAALVDAALVDAAIDGSTTCPVCDTNARCVNTGGNAQCRCNWGYTGNGLSCTFAVDSAIGFASDARTTTIGNESAIHLAVYLRHAGGVVFSGGDIWFTEGTTSCSGNWDLRTVKFTPGGVGPQNISAVCEAEPDSPLVTTIAANTQRAVCFTTYGPPAIPRCGTLGGAPGTFTQTVDLGGRRDGVYMAASPTGFAFATTDVDASYNALGITLARMNSSVALDGAPLTRVSAGEVVVDLGHYTGRWTLFRAMTIPTAPINVDVVDDTGTVTDTVTMAALPAATSRRFLWAGEGEATQRFVYGRDGDLFLGELNDLGQGTARRFATTSVFTIATITPMFGGYGVVHSTDTDIHFLRLSPSGLVTEAERTIVTAAKVQLIGAAFDGNALWVVYATAPAGSENWTVYVRRIA